MVPYAGRREHWAVFGDDDLIRWKKWEGNPFLSWKTRDRHGAPDLPYDKEDMPFIFRESGRTFMLLSSCKIEGKGVVPIYEAEDGGLLNWRYRGIMHDGSGECPNMMKLGDKWVLLYGAYKWVEYFVGDFDVETLKFTPEKQGVVDYSYGPEHPNFYTRGLYATFTFPDPTGRQIMFGWVSGFAPGRGWHGCLSLPRVLSLDEELNLIQTPAPELENLRGGHRRIEDLAIADETKSLEDFEGDTIELVAAFEKGDAAAFGLKLRCDDSGRRGVILRFFDGILNVAGTQVPVDLEADGSTLELHVFLDKSVMELFINGGRACVTRVNYPGSDDLGISVFAEDGGVMLKSLDLWQMQPVW
jgi:beta-fructofuranosidase